MYTTIIDIQKALSSGTTCVEILDYFINRIDNQNQLNVFLEVFKESAQKQARIVDEKIKSNSQGKLAGVVIAIKDNLCYKDHKVSAASKILEGFESIYTSTAVQRLIDEDAIIIGRVNCDEFAMGGSNENSAYGPVFNAENVEYVPGGSSGGSAVAVQSGMCIASLGSDTGGSIRQPASFTGTIGFKPTYGSISRHGLIAYASSFDQIGTFTNCIKDSVVLYNIMHGPDEFDSTCIQNKKEIDVAKLNNSKQLTIGVITDYNNAPGLDPEIKKSIDSLIVRLKEDGAELKEFSFPFLEALVPTYYVITTAEASSNLSRFDGVHYGYRSPNSNGLQDTYIKSRSEGFGPEVKRRIMAGTFVLSHGYYDAYFTKAQKVRRLLKDQTEDIMANCDVVIMPTTISTAFKIGDVKDPVAMYLQDKFTVHANLSGNPAISIPLDVHSNGLPYGLQVMADQSCEKMLFFASKKIENLLNTQ